MSQQDNGDWALGHVTPNLYRTGESTVQMVTGAKPGEAITDALQFAADTQATITVHMDEEGSFIVRPGDRFSLVHQRYLQGLA